MYTGLLEPDQISHTQSMAAKRDHKLSYPYVTKSFETQSGRIPIDPAILAVIGHRLTPSLRRPCIHAIFFPTACRTACKHAFCFLRVRPEAVSTRHSWL